MRCKLNDRVVVVKGLSVGAVGTIIGPARPFSGDSDWMVEFPRPVRGYLGGGSHISEATQVDAPDDYLCPLPGDVEPETVTDDMEVPA